MSFNPKSVRHSAGIIAGSLQQSLQIDFDLLGTDQMEGFYRQFDDAIKRKITRKSVNAACRPVVKKVRSLAPKQTGLLKRSITHLVRTYRKGGAITGVVGQRGQRSKTTKALSRAQGRVAMGRDRRGGISGKGKVVPIHLVDAAVRPHEITANLLKESNSRYLVFKRYGRLNWEKRVHHRGHPGSRFMSRAYDQTKNLALKAFETKFVNEIANEAHKLEWVTRTGADKLAQNKLSGG